MEMLLRIYSPEFFKFQQQNHEIVIYPFRGLLTEKEYINLDIVGMVEAAAKKATKINFRLDELIFPFKEWVITGMELNKIMEKPELLAKTQFWQNDKKVKKESVIKIYNKHKSVL